MDTHHYEVQYPDEELIKLNAFGHLTDVPPTILIQVLLGMRLLRLFSHLLLLMTWMSRWLMSWMLVWQLQQKRRFELFLALSWWNSRDEDCDCRCIVWFEECRSFIPKSLGWLHEASGIYTLSCSPWSKSILMMMVQHIMHILSPLLMMLWGLCQLDKYFMLKPGLLCSPDINLGA